MKNTVATFLKKKIKSKKFQDFDSMEFVILLSAIKGEFKINLNLNEINQINSFEDLEKIILNNVNK